MANPTRKRPAKKPAKPYPDYPLFAHQNGQWAKKVRGRHIFFGVWGDPDASLQKWLNQRDGLFAGRKPRVNGDRLAVKDLANRFLTAKRILVDGGELSARTWVDYHSCCGRLVSALGGRLVSALGGRLVTDLAADDFERLRALMGKATGPALLKVEMQRIRSIFKYGYDAGSIERPVRFGPLFKSPSGRVLQQNRRKNGFLEFLANCQDHLFQLRGRPIVGRLWPQRPVRPIHAIKPFSSSALNLAVHLRLGHAELLSDRPPRASPTNFRNHLASLPFNTPA